MSEKTQALELEWWIWFLTEHLPFTRRYQVAGYRYCEGRYMMQHCGIPQGGLPAAKLTGTLLDVGCGAVSIWEHRRDLEVVAIDPLLRDMVAHPKLKKYTVLGVKNNVFYRSQAIEQAGPSGHYDWVWCYNVLDHVEDWQGALRHCKRVLRPSGTLLLGTDVRTVDYDWGDDERAMHPSLFCGGEVLMVLADIGMKVQWLRPGRGAKYRMGLRAVKGG